MPCFTAGNKSKVMSMVEQFNLRSSKSGGSPTKSSVRDVSITAPIIPPSAAGLANGHTPSVPSPPPPNSSWKTSPLYRSCDSDEEVPDVIKRLSDGTLQGQRWSDTLSSDIIVNSISTG